jgi:crossover junction endodeoxyribonuclease RusA
MTILDVWVPGVPEPQGSLKAFVIGGKARLTSTNKRLKSWRSDVCDAVAAVIGPRPQAFLGPMVVHCHFWFARPASQSGKKGLLPSAPREKITRPDIDKLLRGACDALTIAGVWADDSQVVTIVGHKKFAGEGETVGARILVTSAEEAPAECP